MNGRRVPAVHRWLLRAAAPAEEREWLLADLEEEAAARAIAGGERQARAWSRRQVAASLGPLIIRRVETAARLSWSTTMSIWRGLGSDVRLAVRRLFESPGFSLTCIVTLALGIGGNTAVFTLIDRVVRAPLPVERPHELAAVVGEFLAGLG